MHSMFIAILQDKEKRGMFGIMGAVCIDNFCHMSTEQGKCC